MVINGGSRSGLASYTGYLGWHLQRRDTNELVNVRELAGVTADDLTNAFREMSAMGAGSRSQRPLYHANIDWRHDEVLTDEQKARAVDRLGEELGLSNQPRAVVEHVKEGRAHLHVVWLRIDPETGKAISDSHNFRKHELVSRELEREFGLERVQGAHVEREGVDRPERAPEAYELAQAARSGLTPAQAKAELSEFWRSTDTGRAFVAAIEDAGWRLARGDKRDLVVIDSHGETHSLARRIEGVKAKEVRERMADIDAAAVPTVEQAREAIRDRHAVPVSEPVRVPDVPPEFEARIGPEPVRENRVQDPAPVFRASDPQQEPAKPTPERSHQFTEIDELALMALRRQEAFARQDRQRAELEDEQTPQHRQAKPQPVPEPQVFRRQDPDPTPQPDPSANDGRKAMEDLARTDPHGMAARHGFHAGDELKAPEDMRREWAARLREPAPEPVRVPPPLSWSEMLKQVAAQPEPLPQDERKLSWSEMLKQSAMQDATTRPQAQRRDSGGPTVADREPEAIQRASYEVEPEKRTLEPGRFARIVTAAWERLNDLSARLDGAFARFTGRGAEPEPVPTASTPAASTPAGRDRLKDKTMDDNAAVIREAMRQPKPESVKVPEPPPDEIEERKKRGRSLFEEHGIGRRRQRPGEPGYD